MKRALVAAVLLLAAVATASAQVPAEGLRAEGEHRWRDALAIYTAAVQADTARADLWLRIADIQSTIGNANGAIEALEHAARLRQGDDAIYARLSQAYAAQGAASPALRAIQGALALAPANTVYLRAAGQLASWKGDYAAAIDAYRRLLTLEPLSADVLLSLARVEVWSGETDRAVGSYAAYVRQRPDDAGAWIEWARAESWRGNDAAALRVLERMRRRLGDSAAYRQALASALTRAGRPRHALELVRPLLAAQPLDVDLRLLDALARVGYGDERAARRAYDVLSRLPEPRQETTGLGRQIRMAFGSMLQPAVNLYSDSDGLRIARIPIALTAVLTPAVRLEAGYENAQLHARAGSGLENVDGSTADRVDHGWAGLLLRPTPAVQLRARAGRASANGAGEWTYAAGAAVQLGDAARLGYDHDHQLLVISPRTVSLGLVRDADHAQLAWSPTVTFVLQLEGTRERFSDDNTRYAWRIAPRVSALRRQDLNLDIGAAAYLFGAARNLDHGYYDPRRYEAYTVTAYPYFKFSENYGLSVFAEAGVQRDTSAARFRPGGGAVAELTLGIYNAWVLKANGGLTINNRLESGAYRGWSAGLVLLRRF